VEKFGNTSLGKVFLGDQPHLKLQLQIKRNIQKTEEKGQLKYILAKGDFIKDQTDNKGVLVLEEALLGDGKMELKDKEGKPIDVRAATQLLVQSQLYYMALDYSLANVKGVPEHFKEAFIVLKQLELIFNDPARDEWETFFIDLPAHPQKGLIALTTHTSSGQVREMERVKAPPIRMINIAKCYRRQQDATHTAMFHQFEGLVIDKGINIQHLKGTIEYFAHKFYGPKTKIRLRPYNFKFTEPSFEVDFLCTICHGKGRLINNQKCKLCKAGWLEVAGAGMVHPNVLKFGGISSKKYTGWAFGMGVERAYTLKPGLQLDDIRPFYSNNLEFLNQF